LNLVSINSTRSYSTKRELLNRVYELELQNKELTSKLQCLEVEFINLNKKNMEIIKKYKKILIGLPIICFVLTMLISTAAIYIYIKTNFITINGIAMPKAYVEEIIALRDTSISSALLKNLTEINTESLVAISNQNLGNWDITQNIIDMNKKDAIPHPLTVVLKYCDINIFDIARSYHPSYFVPYTFGDISTLQVEVPKPLSLSTQIGIVAFQDLKFEIEMLRILDNFAAIDNKTLTFYPYEAEEGFISSLDIIAEFSPELKTRIQNIINEANALNNNNTLSEVVRNMQPPKSQSSHLSPYLKDHFFGKVEFNIGVKK
jgi:hypothetical protein